MCSLTKLQKPYILYKNFAVKKIRNNYQFYRSFAIEEKLFYSSDVVKEQTYNRPVKFSTLIETKKHIDKYEVLFLIYEISKNI